MIFKDFITPIISEDIEHLWKDDDLNHSDDIHICSYGEYLKHKNGIYMELFNNK